MKYHSAEMFQNTGIIFGIFTAFYLVAKLLLITLTASGRTITSLRQCPRGMNEIFIDYTLIEDSSPKGPVMLNFDIFGLKKLTNSSAVSDVKCHDAHVTSRFWQAARFLCNDVIQLTDKYTKLMISRWP